MDSRWLFCVQALGVVSISGSPGLEDEKLREARAAQDTALAQTMREGGLKSFIHSWYQQPLWERLVTVVLSSYLANICLRVSGIRVTPMVTVE